MKTPEDGDKVGTGLGQKVAPKPAPSDGAKTWSQVPGRPDYETDGSAIRRKVLPPNSIWDFFGIPRP